ncbi:hypothetical protein PCE1_004990 [Barthelona sp. PCE]
MDSSIRKLRKRIDALQSENENLKVQAMQQKNEFTNQIGLLQKQIEDLQRKKVELIAKTDSIRTLESELVELYLDTVDRSHLDLMDEQLIEEQRNRERRNMKKLNSIELVNYLRSNLSLLIQFKEDFETELSGKVNRRYDTINEKSNVLKEENKKLTLDLADCQENQSVLQLENDRLVELNTQLEEKLANNDRLNQSIRTELGEAKHKLNGRDRLFEEKTNLLTREVKNGELKQLVIEKQEVEICLLSNRHKNLFTKITNTKRIHEEDLLKMRQNESTLQKVITEQDIEIKALKKNLQSYKRNIVLARQNHFETERKRLQTMLNEKNGQLSEHEKEIRSLRSENMKLAERNIGLKREYDKLFRIAQRGEKEMTNVKQRAEKRSDENALETVLVKGMLEKKSKENDSLKSEIERLQHQGSRMMMSSVSRDAERSKFREKIEHVREEAYVARVVSNTPTKKPVGTPNVGVRTAQ